jgi:methyl-accepting chemotaxis protein/methyl-accepting chemotaxis protein-1 (serine sensor receptor)
MVTSMSEINNASDKIARIIKVIDEIAFQTNILALNAAVEAARAGEAGMGFAVVADEVRNLAQRSAQAAKDTASIIEESIERSNEGSKKLEQVKEAITAITDSAGKVKTLVDEVSTGSQEQATGFSEITSAISQMERVTQTAAAGAEQSASASEELTAQAESMRAAVETLHLLTEGGERRQSIRKPVRLPAKSPSAGPAPADARPAVRVAPNSQSEPAPPDSEDEFPLDDDFR